MQIVLLGESQRASVKDHPLPPFPHVAMTVIFKEGHLNYAAQDICIELHLQCLV